MSELRQSLKRMKKSLCHIFPEEPTFEPLQSMKTVAETLAEKIMQQDLNTQQADSVKQILKKIKQGAPLTKRDCRDLPFVIADTKCDRMATIVCIKNLDISKERILKRLILVYFMDYMHLDENKRTVLRSVIIKGLTNQDISPINQFMKRMKEFAKVLFTKSCTQNISRIIERKGLIECANSLDLPEQIKLSDLIIDSTLTFFAENKFSLSRKMEIIQEVIKNSDPFHAVFPAIADSLIKSIDECSEPQEPQYRNFCVDAFYKELGDPRFTKYAVRWNKVSNKSRRIFLSWLAEKDLNLFFKIIEKTAVDDMWSYRRNFWLRYLPYITSTWVFFGKEAIYYADQITNSRNSYGKLGKLCLPNHSVFAFQIGRYLFVEWSHNGILRVWNADNAPEIFGKESIDKRDITDSVHFPIAEWKHAGKTTGNWQRKVRDWISANCGVNPFIASR